jgi:YesN/AraC family two-component response regulator
MNDEAGKTLVRIEAALDRIISHMPDSDAQEERYERIEELLEKLYEEATEQTRLLKKLWTNDRSRD